MSIVSPENNEATGVFDCSFILAGSTSTFVVVDKTGSATKVRLEKREVCCLL